MAHQFLIFFQNLLICNESNVGNLYFGGTVQTGATEKGPPPRTRTSYRQLRRLMLYPDELVAVGGPCWTRTSDRAIMSRML